jgi:hypothetical protein
MVKDDAAAWQWIEAAAKQGHPVAQFNAGLLCVQGRNTGSSVGGAAAAAAWWLRAAEQGHPGAQHRFARLRYDGALGVPASTDDAVQWWRAAAAQGHAEAQCALGCVHQRGSACGSVPVNLAQAAVLFEQAAQGGSADGAYHLAYFYAEGVGAEKDLEVATALLQLAANRGHAPARAMLRRLQQQAPAGAQQPPQSTSAARLSASADDDAAGPEEDGDLPNLDESAVSEP